MDIRGYPIHECPACTHRFVGGPLGDSHVEDVYSDEYFSGGVAGYTDYLGQAELLRNRGRSYAKWIQRYRTAGRMIDVGAAAGFFLEGWLDEGWQGIGIEPNVNMVQCARNRQLDVRCGTLESLITPEFAPVDCVAMIQVAAHLVDPARAFSAAECVLRPGGLLLIETWDRSSWTARAFGKHWHEYAPPSVLHWFNRRSIYRLLERTGFEFVRDGRVVRWLNMGHAQSLLQNASDRSKIFRGIARAARWLPRSWNVIYPGDDLFWVLARKSNVALVSSRDRQPSEMTLALEPNSN